MCQQQQIVALAPTRRAVLPGEVAALADTKQFAQTLNGELRFRLIDEPEPH